MDFIVLAVGRGGRSSTFGSVRLNAKLTSSPMCSNFGMNACAKRRTGLMVSLWFDLIRQIADVTTIIQTKGSHAHTHSVSSNCCCCCWCWCCCGRCYHVCDSPDVHSVAQLSIVRYGLHMNLYFICMANARPVALSLAATAISYLSLLFSVSLNDVFFLLFSSSSFAAAHLAFVFIHLLLLFKRVFLCCCCCINDAVANALLTVPTINRNRRAHNMARENNFCALIE